MTGCLIFCFELRQIERAELLPLDDDYERVSASD